MKVELRLQGKLQSYIHDDNNNSSTYTNTCPLRKVFLTAKNAKQAQRTQSSVSQNQIFANLAEIFANLAVKIK